MRMNQVFGTLTAVFGRATRTVVVMLSGAPGSGKSAIAAQAAAACHKRVMALHLPSCEAVDLRGLPHTVDGRTVWASPLPREGEGVLILDEMASAAPDVQVAAHHIVHAEAGSDMSMPEGWHIVLTGNRASDRTLYKPLSGPLRNRVTMLDVEADPLQWAAWAASNGVHPFVQAFVRWLPDSLCASEVPVDGAFASGRAWVGVSNILALALNPLAEAEMFIGTVGKAMATKFSAYLEMARKLPAIETLMADPDNAVVPKEPSLCYALACSLAQYTLSRQYSAMRYIARLPAEYGALYIRDVRDGYDIRADEGIRTWIATHKKLFQDDA